MKAIPTTLPQDMQAVVAMLKQTTSQEQCLQEAYSLLTKKYHGNRMKTLLRFPDLFPRSIDEPWLRSGFLHCTNLNWILRTLLVNSGHFSAQDVRTRWTLLWFISPHQYLQIAMKDEEKINIDVWAKVYGIPFGDYAHGLHVYGER